MSVHRQFSPRSVCSGRPHITDGCDSAMMRVAQVAIFYGLRSGGLRTAVDRLGAEYCAASHEVYLLGAGPRSTRTRMPSGVTRITLPALQIPFAGGYRGDSVGCHEVARAVEAGRTRGLRPVHPALAGCLGCPWWCHHGDGLARATGPADRASAPRAAGPPAGGHRQSPHRGQLRHRAVHHCLRPRGVRPHLRPPT